MTSKAERRRRKKMLQDAHRLAPIERDKQPRNNGRFAPKDATDPRTTALHARKGYDRAPPSQKELKALTDPLRGSAVGICLLTFCEDDEALRLNELFLDYSQAIGVYRSRILGQTGRPKGQSLEVEAQSGGTPDLRTEDEKIRAAVNHYMHWQGVLGSITQEAAYLIRRAYDQDGPALINADKVATATGLRTVYALREAAKIV